MVIDVTSDAASPDLTEPVSPLPIIDPRRHDAVVIDVMSKTDADASAIGAFTRRLSWTGVATCALPPAPGGVRCCDVAGPRTVLISDSLTVVEAAQTLGYGFVIGLTRNDNAGSLLGHGADTVAADLAAIDIRTGDLPVTQLPSAVDSEAQLQILFTSRDPIVFLDFDGTLSTIEAQPGDATLVEGAAQALVDLASACTVAIVSGRDLEDIRHRVGVAGLWYAGSHGIEVAAPDGTIQHPIPDPGIASALRDTAAALQRRLAHIPGAYVEHKSFAVAVHFRNVDGEHQDEVMQVAARCGRQYGLRYTCGRRVIDLRPAVDRNKGSAVRWITEHTPLTHRSLPIYIGDDITDEDAFDAVRSGGIPVMVHHEEDGDRPTAARYSVQSPGEVCTLLRHFHAWLTRREDTDAAAWSITYDGYDPSAETLREALCTVGNGYFATRGAAPESAAGDTHYPATYVAGVFNRLDETVAGHRTHHESLVNLPNWLAVTFRIEGGPWFDIDAVSLLNYHQTFDLRTAVMTRQVRFRDEAGRTTSVTQRRFAAMHLPHVAALTTTVTAQDWSGTIEFRSLIDGDVRNRGVRRYRELADAHLRRVRVDELSDDSVLMVTETTQSRIPVALAARTTLARGGAVMHSRKLIHETLQIGHQFVVEATVGIPVSVEKVVFVATGRDVAISEPAEYAIRQLARLGSVEEIRAGHELRWSHLWQRLSIDLTGHTDELRVLRLHLLHLLQTTSPNTADLDVGVPARGLHGEAYRGHVFWDEVFILPVLNLRFPTIARGLLHYRYRRLAEARNAAALAGYSGAMFPWQSGSDGREESPEVHLNPRSGRWNPDSSRRAHHAGIAVAYNVWQFYQVSGDLAHLIDFGAELLVEIARFWVSRTTYDPNRARYCINGVIGPDEFHSGYPDRPHSGIDNNAYTNVMAAWVIVRALEALDMLPLPARLDLREKLDLTDSELAHWDEVSRRMYVPFHDDMISQFDGYAMLHELDWDAYRTRYGNIQRLDRILEAEGDDVNRYKAAKQADVLMLLYLLSSDELREILGRLGYHLAPDRIPVMVDYYLARTSHGSTLSAVVNTWVLARANRNRALEFFEQVLASDIADIQGGTTSEGIHLAAMAGSVDLVQRCFTGLETRGDRIVLSPLWPESDEPLSISLHYRGQHLHVSVRGRYADVSAEYRDDAHPVLIECRGQVRELAPGHALSFGEEDRSTEAVADR